jgi:hypothetical protein
MAISTLLLELRAFSLSSNLMSDGVDGHKHPASGTEGILTLLELDEGKHDEKCGWNQDLDVLLEGFHQRLITYPFQEVWNKVQGEQNDEEHQGLENPLLPDLFLEGGPQGKGKEENAQEVKKADEIHGALPF